MSPAPLFSLIIPCYNEAGSLPELIVRSRFVAAQGDGEVILVDNGSSDGTAEILARELVEGESVRSIRVEVNTGYGAGIVAGLDAAEGSYIGWTHADLQTDPADVLRVLDLLRSGGRLFVKGTRYGRPLSDRVFTVGMSIFETILLRTRLNDINAQPTLFNRELLTEWGEPPADFALDLFAIYRARRLGYRVVRFPVIFAPRRFGTSSWNVDLAGKRKFIERTLRFSLALRRNL